MYSCFSENGTTMLPSQNEIDEIIADGIEPVIFLDSCVCLHIIKVMDYGRKATGVDLSRVVALKEYLSKNNGIKISPFFGFMELCVNGNGFNKDKFRALKYRMDFFEQIPLKFFKQFKYDFDRDLVIFRDPTHNMQERYDHILDILKPGYCTLLKIRSLALNGLTKEKAEKNLEEFIDWMIYELDSARGPEYKLALNIFGGNTVYRKMIGLDSNSNIKKKLMGTCWDFFHAKNSANSFRLFEMLQRNICPFFITSDANLYNIFKAFSLTVIKDGGQNFTSSFLMGSDFDFPHLTTDFMERQNRKMLDFFVDRRNHMPSINVQKVDAMTLELEQANGILP